jgi:hypothetical protein
METKFLLAPARKAVQAKLTCSQKGILGGCGSPSVRNTSDDSDAKAQNFRHRLDPHPALMR